MAQLRRLKPIRLQLSVVIIGAALVAGCSESETTNPAAPTPPVATTPPPAPPPAPTPPPQGCAVPATPSGLTISSFTTRVTLTWSAVPNVQYYELIIGSGPSNSDILFTNTTLTTYEWNGAHVGTHYARIGARNSCGSSVTSAPVQFTVTG